MENNREHYGQSEFAKKLKELFQEHPTQYKDCFKTTQCPQCRSTVENNVGSKYPTHCRNCGWTK